MDRKTPYNHRDLSWIDFNERVLEEAVDVENPLLSVIGKKENGDGDAKNDDEKKFLHGITGIGDFPL